YLICGQWISLGSHLRYHAQLSGRSPDDRITWSDAYHQLYFCRRFYAIRRALSINRLGNKSLVDALRNGGYFLYTAVNRHCAAPPHQTTRSNRQGFTNRKGAYESGCPPPIYEELPPWTYTSTDHLPPLHNPTRLPQ